MIFRNRRAAGMDLGLALSASYGNRRDVLVLGLPRGGVPVAYEVAKALGCPFDVFVVRKLGTPGREELAMGAIASGGLRVLSADVIEFYRIPAGTVDAVIEREQRELARRENLYRGNRPPAIVTGRTVVLVDDGLATGSTMKAAIGGLRQLHPAKVVVAVPTGAAEVCAEFREIADDVVCLATPEPFISVGAWYEDFRQTTDEEVLSLTAT
jgi:putative phosphoribosyl transferase